MADKQSREVHKPSELALLIRTIILERGLDYVNSLTPQQVDTILDLMREAEAREERKGNEAKKHLRVDIDCSDALKGLKAVQREAKKATAALKELEEQQKKVTGVITVNNSKCPRCDGNRLETLTMKELATNSLVSEESKCLDCGWTP